MQQDDTRIADFLFEVGTMRKLPRIHRQMLLTDDTSDTIATHSYRVAFIGWILAKREGADPYKTVMMCLLHDLGEVRSGDHNWVHKRYVTIHDEEVMEEQLGTLPFRDFLELAREYEARESTEAIAAKDADVLDQVLLLREYEWQGNREASVWLQGKRGEEAYAKLKQLKLDSAKRIGKALYDRDPSEWWNDIWTSQNRK